MAIYRTIQLSFWTDSKVADDFTPEDKYFYLYLLTNPNTNLCGCYDFSFKRAESELGYTQDTINKLLNRMKDVHKVIDYDSDTKEILVTNWCKFNWTSSEKFLTACENEIIKVKSNHFREFLALNIAKIRDSGSSKDTVWIPYPYPMDTTVTDTVTVYASDLEKDKGKEQVVVDRESEGKKEEEEKREKKKPASRAPKKCDGEIVQMPQQYYEDPRLNEAYSGYVEMRKRMKKPFTERAQKMVQKRLNILATDPFGRFDPETAARILDESVINGWTNIYALKSEEGRGNARNGAIDWSRV